MGAITAAPAKRSTMRSSSSTWWFCVPAASIMPFSVGDASWLTLTPPVATWNATSMPLACAAAHSGSSARELYGTGDVAGRMIARAPSAAHALDLGDRVVDVAQRDRRRREHAIAVRREGLEHVVAVHAGVRHGELVVVVRVQPEQRVVGMQQRRPDAFVVEVVDDPIGITRLRRPVVVAVPHVGPALEARRVQLPEVGIRLAPERRRLEVLFPDRELAQVPRQATDEQIRRFDEVPVRGDDEILGHRCFPSGGHPAFAAITCA